MKQGCLGRLAGTGDPPPHQIMEAVVMEIEAVGIEETAFDAARRIHAFVQSACMDMAAGWTEGDDEAQSADEMYEDPDVVEELVHQGLDGEARDLPRNVVLDALAGVMANHRDLCGRMRDGTHAILRTVRDKHVVCYVGTEDECLNWKRPKDSMAAFSVMEKGKAKSKENL